MIVCQKQAENPEFRDARGISNLTIGRLNVITWAVSRRTLTGRAGHRAARTWVGLRCDSDGHFAGHSAILSASHPALPPAAGDWRTPTMPFLLVSISTVDASVAYSHVTGTCPGVSIRSGRRGRVFKIGAESGVGWCGRDVRPDRPEWQAVIVIDRACTDDARVALGRPRARRSGKSARRCQRIAGLQPN